MGATLSVGSDRYPFTIIEVYARKSGKIFEIAAQEDQAEMIAGSAMSEHQEYRYTPDPNGPISRFTLRKDGRWIRRGESMRGQALRIGHRNKYRDPSF